MGGGRWAVVTASAAVMAVIVTGCGQRGDPATAPHPVPTSTPIVSGSPTPSPTPSPSAEHPAPTDPGPAPSSAPVVTVAHGDVIATEAQWNALGLSGFGYYPMSDGTYIVTDPAKDFPTRVSLDIQASLDAIGEDRVEEHWSITEAHHNATRSLAWQITSTGKKAVLVRLGVYAVPYPTGVSAGRRWAATASSEGWWMQWEHERARMTANVHEWVTQNTAPGEWVVFVGPGSDVPPDQ